MSRTISSDEELARFLQEEEYKLAETIINVEEENAYTFSPYPRPRPPPTVFLPAPRVPQSVLPPPSLRVSSRPGSFSPPHTSNRRYPPPGFFLGGPPSVSSAELEINDAIDRGDYEKLVLLDEHKVCVGLKKEAMDMLIPSRQARDSPECCPICLEKVVAGQMGLFLPCFHLFHPDCIYQHFKGHHDCPVCQKDVEEMLNTRV